MKCQEKMPVLMPCDRDSFVDLLTKTVKVDASERITLSQILQHPFITMSHLVGTFDSSF